MKKIVLFKKLQLQLLKKIIVLITILFINFCFVSAQPPVITSFTPTSAKPGDQVTLTGTDFDADVTKNIVFFGATRATVTNASSTSITATVPSGATYAPITLLNTTTNLSCESLIKFNPTYYPARENFLTSNFPAKMNFPTGIKPQSAAIGDLDADGKPDLVVVNNAPSTISGMSVGSVSVFLNNTSSSGFNLGTKVDFATNVNEQYFVAIGDLNMDGKPDLAIATFGANCITTLMNTTTTPGDVTFANKINTTTVGNARCSSLAIGDLNGDGKPDLAITNFATANSTTGLSILVNNTGYNATTFSSSSTISYHAVGTGSGPNGARGVAIGDLNADGKPEVVVANFKANSISVFHNLSSGGSLSLGNKVEFSTGTGNNGTNTVAIGDLNADGKPDLVVTNHYSSSVSVFQNTSTSETVTLGDRIDFTTALNPREVAIGDLTGDGNPELVVAGSNADSVSVFRNTTSSGAISFGARVNFKTGVTPYGVAIGDLTGDGKPDLAVTNWGENSVSVFLNGDCTNPTSGGTIAASQSGSSGFDPEAFTSSAEPTGHNGTLEYKWQSSTTSNSAGFNDIASSNSVTYDAGTLTQTTWFKRLARVDCSSGWSSAAESNVLKIQICSSIPSTPTVNVVNNCGTSTLSTTASASGTLLWSTGETTSSINVSSAGTYTVTQTVDGCISEVGSADAAPLAIPSTPSVDVVNNCNGTSTLSTTESGTLLWSTNETTTSITVTIAGTYTVTQTVDGCTSAAGSGVAAPKTNPIATAGADQALCNTSTFTLAGNNPTSPSTGEWSFVGSGGTSVITTSTSATSTVTLVPTNTNIRLRWTVTDGTCSSTDDVVIRNDASVTTAAAGSDQSLCNTSTFTLAGNSPTSPAIGAWSFVGSGGTSVITTPSSATTTITLVPTNTNITLRWTLTNGTCSSTDDVVIRNDAQSTATAGADQSLCNTSTFTLAGNNPTSPTSGVWSFVGSGGTSMITTPSSATSTVTLVPTNTNITLRWTVTNGTCSSTDDVVIRNDAQSTATAGADQALCNTSTFTLNGNTPSSGTGAWSFVGSAGSASITNSSSQSSTVTSVSSSTDITLRWTITNGTCSSTDDVIIRNNPLPDATISANGATTFTYGNSVTLSAPSVGKALTLNGTSNYVSIPSNINNSIVGNNITIEGWFYITSTFNLTGLITEALGGDNNVKFGITSGVVSGAQKIYAGFTNNGSSTSVTSSENLPLNKWTHIAATYNGSSLNVYVNGTLTGTVANTSGLPTGTDAWYFGKASSGSNLFPGTMDEIRIWNVARSQSDINANKNTVISTTSIGLVGYYKLDETSGSNAADATGNGYTGIVN